MHVKNIYNIPEIKYISRKKAAELLHLKQNEFEELCLLTNTKPIIAKNNSKYDHLDSLFYKINEVQSMFDTKAYDTIINRNNVEKRRKEYIIKKREERLKRLKEVEHNYPQLLKERYKTFDQSIIGLSDSLKVLYFVKKMEENEQLNILLRDFKVFVKEHQLIENVFSTTKGMCFLIKISDIEVLWVEPSFVIQLDSNIEKIMSMYKFAYYHLKLVLHKLRTMNLKKNKEMGLFQGKKFYLEAENEHIEYLIDYCKGEICDSHKNVDIYISDKDIKDFNLDTQYLQPQYILDVFNNISVDCLNYTVGKELPEHICPFEKNEDEEFDEELLELLSKTKRRKIDEILKENEKYKK